MDNEKTARSSRDGSSEASPKAVDEIRQSVLVVDDEENFLTLLKWFLSQRGYDVSTALSADEALDMVENQNFDIALLDIKLGNGNGLILLEQATARWPRLKVIMMTAYPTVSSLKQAFSKGAMRYLTKPVDLQELTEALRLLV
ncbi:MAG: response regulator [Betaproteobacteria bacterium]